MGNSTDSLPPLQVRVRNLETGMVIAKPVYTRDGCTLLQEGKELTTADIDRLNQWNQRYVYIQRPDNDAGTADSGFARAS